MVIWQRRINAATFGAYACTKSDGRRRVLATGENDPYGQDWFSHYYVNGDFVAFSHLFYDHYGDGSLDVVVARLRGPVRTSHLAVGYLSTYAPTLKISELVVSKRGRPAYIVVRDNPDYPLPGQLDYDLPMREVHNARGKLLDSGPVRRLKPRHSRLTWLHGKTRRSAPFN